MGTRSDRMIVSASYRTDIPAFYGAWFQERRRAGYARVANPYGGPPYRVPLDSDSVDGFVFWTRNAGPFMTVLDDLARTGVPFVVQFTVTGYPRLLENSVVDPARASAQIIELAERFGPRVVVWRYDPILFGALTEKAFHRANFAKLADRLAGRVDEVVVSYAHFYRKTRRNLDAIKRRDGVDWREPPAEERRSFTAELAAEARARGMRLTVCAQEAAIGGAAGAASCIDAKRLADVGGRPLTARQKGNRPGCLCAESRDIGAYDTCPHGCVYCYAVRDRNAARRSHRRHDPSHDQL